MSGPQGAAEDGGIAAAVAVTAATAPPRRRPGMRLAAAAAVAAVAVAFRVAHLETVPPGLYVDEVLTARNALAWRLAPQTDWLGGRPLLHAGWVETSNLYLAFVSGVLRLFGDGFFAIRMVSVFPSLAAVALLYALGREIGGRRAGWLAAFLLGASHWAARTGRTGWDQVLMVALQLAALLLLARATRGGRPWPALAGGALLGLSLATYVASRLVVLHGIAWQAWEALRGSSEARTGRSFAHRPAARLVLTVVAAAAVAAPLLLHQPAIAAGGTRVRQLAVWALSGPGEPWATLGHNSAAHALMFHLRGGAYTRDALPGWPMLDPVTGALLLAGLAVVATTPGWRRRLLLSWPAFAVLGGVLSISGEGPPYPYRVGSLGAWACLVAALGGLRLWDAVPAPRRRTAGALAAVGLVAVLAANGWVLFVAGPAYPGRLVYGTAETAIGLWLRDHRAGRPAWVHRDALRQAPPARDFPHADANRHNFFRPVDSATALQLAAGVYRAHPRRALAPLAAAGDVDLVAELPRRVGQPSIFVVPSSGATAVARRWRVQRSTALHHRDGAPLAVVLEIAGAR